LQKRKTTHFNALYLSPLCFPCLFSQNKTACFKMQILSTNGVCVLRPLKIAELCNFSFRDFRKFSAKIFSEK